MRHRNLVLAAATALVLLAAGSSSASPERGHDAHEEVAFKRIATLANYFNNADIGQQTVSEIVAATRNGMTLVYTDSPGEQVGFVDITDPYSPVPTGTLAMAGEPTSVDVLGNRFALVAVNTSASLTATSGKLVVVDLTARTIVRELDLGGQPDSIKISPDERYAAVAIENERDEDLVVDGVEGGLPQTAFGNPPGLASRRRTAGSPTSPRASRSPPTAVLSS